MSGTKENALIISNKATPVTPTISGDISVVARNGFLYTFDGIVEKQIGDTSAIENRLTVVEANDNDRFGILI